MYSIRYYAIGHSYLRHGPFEGWQTDGFWGMAASEPSKDYFHRFISMLTDTLPASVEALAENHADYERICTVGATREDYESSEGYKHMSEVLRTFKPNVVSVFVGGGNTVAKDKESLTLFYDVLYDMIKKNLREDATVLCIGTNDAFNYHKAAAEKYGFIPVDCTFIHAKSGRDNPYYAFLDYPEYDEEARAGAVEFRTHPNNLGHEKIAEKMLECGKSSIAPRVSEGDFDEEYSFKQYLLPDKVERFNIRTTPEFLVRIGGFNIRQSEDLVSFSSAPGTGASISASCIHIRPENNRFFVEMSVDCDSYPQSLRLTLNGSREYTAVIPDGNMRRYEFDISDKSEMIAFMKVQPEIDECLIKVRELGFLIDN